MEILHESDEKIDGLDGVTIGDFWSWAYSDFLMNTNRAIFAEFLVGTALNAVGSPRIEWDCVDLFYGEKKVEVKCSAYLQSWNQKKQSSIRYDIKKKHLLDEVNNVYSDEPIRASDCYVFCLYNETVNERANALDINSWEFYVLAKSSIDHIFGDQQSVALSVLKKHCNPVSYCDLKNHVDHVLEFTENNVQKLK